MKGEYSVKKKPENEGKTYYLPIFMSIGLSVGMAIGAGIGNISMGMCLGLAMGVGLGTALDAKNRKEESVAPEKKNQEEEKTDL